MQNSPENLPPGEPAATTPEEAATPEEMERRDLVQKFGKYALYAAPFTVLARTNRAEAASTGGPHKGPIPRS